MILIPELETILILVPRTGSGALRRAVAKAYPRSTLLYRHMEADGVPTGYDRWRRIGLVRHPVDRLWSLYKYLQDFDGDYEPAYIRKLRNSVLMPFSEWIVNNQIPFTNPYDSAGLGRFHPAYAVLHNLPENQKSQFVYLRPDLGTHVLPFTALRTLAETLKVNLLPHNATSTAPAPALTEEAESYMRRWFEWDFQAVNSLTC